MFWLCVLTFSGGFGSTWFDLKSLASPNDFSIAQVQCTIYYICIDNLWCYLETSVWNFFRTNLDGKRLNSGSTAIQWTKTTENMLTERKEKEIQYAMDMSISSFLFLFFLPISPVNEQLKSEEIQIKQTNWYAILWNGMCSLNACINHTAIRRFIIIISNYE